MNYGYIRVSSDKQTVENQRFEIQRFCQAQGITIDGWIEETISGTKSYDKRKLGKLLDHVVANDLIICSELSRLGRNLFMVMEILNICMSKECRVWTIKDNYRLGDDIQSKVLAFAFGLSAEIERNLISQRTKEALALRRAQGVTLGRPKGSPTRRELMHAYPNEDTIVSLRLKGVSLRHIAEVIGISRGSLSRYINAYLPELKAENIASHPGFDPKFQGSKRRYVTGTVRHHKAGHHHATIKRMLEEGQTYRAIASAIGVSYHTVSRYAHEFFKGLAAGHYAYTHHRPGAPGGNGDTDANTNGNTEV